MKCKNCSFTPVYLGNKCPNCGKEVIKGKQKKDRLEENVKNNFTLNISNTDIKNIENLCKDLKSAKSLNDNFSRYIKLVTFIEELSCKVHFDNYEDIEDLVVILEKNSAERISSFFDRILPLLDKAEGNYKSVITKKKYELEKCIKSYNQISEQNIELKKEETKIHKENKNIESLKLKIKELNGIKKNIKENDINKLISTTTSITKVISGNITEQTKNLLDIADSSLEISKLHNESNQKIVGALKETIQTIKMDKNFDKDLLLLYDDIVNNINKLNQKIENYDYQVKKATVVI